MIYQPVRWPNANVHRLFNPVTCCENDSVKTLLYISQFFSITYEDLGVKGCVIFDFATRENGVAIIDKTLK